MKINPIWISHTRTALLILTLTALTGCSSFYVDGTTKDIPPSQYRHIEPIHPVQVLFEFQTKGATNAVATDFLKQSVMEQIGSSGLFSDVSEEPVTGGALLGITLNNVPVDDDAFSKGFVTGLTFGLAGSQVTDGYVCSATYSDGTNTKEPIVKRARHAIHTTIGAAKEPGNAVKAANLEEAVKTMTRQIISNVLNDLSNDVAFK
jgi:hypothetical protein